jgi:hypothetical protein
MQHLAPRGRPPFGSWSLAAAPTEIGRSFEVAQERKDPGRTFLDAVDEDPTHTVRHLEGDSSCAPGNDRRALP